MMCENNFLSLVLGIATTVITDLISTWLRSWLNNDKDK